MNQIIKKTSGLLLVTLMALLIAGGSTSCKSKKKLAREQAAAEYAAKVEQSKTDLNAIVDGTTHWTLDEQDKRLEVIKSYNLDDQEVKDLIVKAESTISMKRAEMERKAEEENLRKAEEARKLAAQTRYAPIESQFDAVAYAKSVEEANRQIEMTLPMYATPDVPVLIIISREAGINDYDRPTTISMFLNYLKDKKRNIYKVETVKNDNQGKITELELIKK
ncbi:MAG: hypothetical protein COW63_13085 [Bacteroidetes bacterium CG18_big_fil_WC_8_21_14_2_50_41_14]|nr:MAG: hypothetical protein COW63_13085 [Bacteroidetes bacterium CG18_big_fil_WC_8_21_14_2_50_41_14]